MRMDEHLQSLASKQASKQAFYGIFNDEKENRNFGTRLCSGGGSLL